MLERWDELSKSNDPNTELITDEKGAIRNRRQTLRRFSSSSSENDELNKPKPTGRWGCFREAVKRFSR